MKYLSVIMLCLLTGVTVAHAAVTPVRNVIVNPGNASALSSTTGLSAAEAQNVIDQAAPVQVTPEINIPADGATISGSNVVIKGIATPNASIDILIQPATGGGGPTFGKAVSDRYGVWSYTLAPTLPAGAYTVQATAQTGSAAPLQSQTIRFSVLGGGISSSLTSSLGISGDSYLIIIIAVIISLTFIITVVILATVPYARSRGATDADRMRAWEAPELASMSDAQWKNFVKNTEAMRQYLKVAGTGGDHARGGHAMLTAAQ